MFILPINFYIKALNVFTSTAFYTNYAPILLLLVERTGVEPVSQQFTSHTLRFLLVNVLMISQNIRFKAILSHSDAFLGALWVANPLSTSKRLETTFYIANFDTLPHMTLRFLMEYIRILDIQCSV